MKDSSASNAAEDAAAFGFSILFGRRAMVLCGAMAVTVASAAAALTAGLAAGIDTSATFLGGLTTAHHGVLLFNWHPVLMVASLVLGSTAGSVAYRLLPSTVPHVARKAVHVTMHSMSVVCMSAGLAAVFQSHNDPSNNAGHIYLANLYSVHALVGLAAVILYLLNYALGAVAFLPGFLPLLPRSLVLNSGTKRGCRQLHASLGVCSLVAGAVAAATGLMDLARLRSCGYAVTSPNYDPARTYGQLTPGCQRMNTVAVLILASLLFATFTLVDTSRAADDAVVLAAAKDCSRGVATAARAAAAAHGLAVDVMVDGRSAHATLLLDADAQGRGPVGDELRL